MKLFPILCSDLSEKYRWIAKLAHMVPFSTAVVVYVPTKNDPNYIFPMNSFKNFKEYIVNTYKNNDFSRYDTISELEKKLKKERVEVQGLIQLVYDVYGE